MVPKIKVSENPAKITTPHFKKVYRLFAPGSGKAFADYITVFDETVDGAPLHLFDPDATWKSQTIDRYEAVPLLRPIFRSGELVYRLPTLEEARAYCAQQVDTLWDEVKRFENPHNYYVDLSPKLWQIKHDLLEEQGHRP